MSRNGGNGGPPFLPFGRWLRERFGGPVRKVSVDAGFSCPNRGGPKGSGGCAFCENRAFGPGTSGGVRAQVLEQLKRMRRPPERFIVYFQPFTNTFAPVERLEELWEEALSLPGAVGIAAGTRPDCLPEEVLELASRFARRTMFWMEVGVQTACDETLALVNRGHSWAETALALHRLSRRPEILTCVHLVIGLPGEGRREVLRTAELTAAFRPSGVKLHHLHVVKGTPLHWWYAEGLVELLAAEEYASLAADVLERMPPDAAVQRLCGEVRGDLLVAPDWGLSKHEVAEMIAGELRRRGSRQGTLFRG